MNNNKRHWGRRLGLGVAWFIAVTVAFYFCIIRGVEIDWFTRYAGYLTLGIGFIDGCLTVTDSVLKK